MKFLPDLFLAERAGSDWICQLLWGVLFMYHCAAGKGNDDKDRMVDVIALLFVLEDVRHYTGYNCN